MKKSFLRKILNVISALAIVSQSLTPYAVLLPQVASAQEVIADPTPTLTSPTASEGQAVEEVVPTEEVTPTPSDTVSETLTPTPTEDPAIATPTPVDNLSPPVDSSGVQGDSTLASPTASEGQASTPTPEPTPIESGQTGDEQLNLIILDNVSAPSIDLEAVESQGSAVLTTDKPDYAPTDTALITGSNLLPNTTYTLRVWSDDEPPTSTTVEVTSDENGVFAYAYQLDGTYRPNYSAELKDSAGNVVATTTFTDTPPAPNPAGDLDQCANGGVGDPPVSCTTSGPGGAWQNGNLNQNQAHYFEGDSVPYRLRMSNLSTSISHTVIIEWDTTQSGKHAIDYLTSFDRTETTANPCAGVAGCTLAGPKDTESIPVDPNVTGGGVTPIAGVFTLFNGTITGVSSYTLSGTYAGNSSTRISISFTTTVSDPVLAWGGHIATRGDWGAANSAIAISGSPYHMRFIDLDGAGGNQDRSLAAAAVIFPASITIIKDATPEGSTSFPFTASPSPLGNFNLVDDGTSANTQTFSGITTFTSQQGSPLYIVTENTPAGWSLTNLSCSVTSPNGGSQTVNGSTATIDLQEGENVTCIFTNTLQETHLTLVKTVTNDNGGTALATAWTLSASGPTPISGATGASAVTNALVGAGTYTLSESGGPSGYTASDYSCVTNGGNPVSGNSITLAPGDDATCTINNNDIQPKLTVTKIVVNDNGGTKVVSDFPLFVNATGVTSGVQNGFNAGSYVVSETQQTGYTQTSITGNCDANGNVTLAAGDVKACTITNNDNAPSLTLEKVVTNDNGGTATPANFTLTATGPTGFSGVGPSVSNGASFDAGTYALSESSIAGYSASSWVCSGGTQDGSNITVGLGQNATCTITNTDDAPKLTLNKIVTNDNGGAALESAWTLTATGPTTISGPGAAGSTDVVSDASFDAGSYVLSESTGPAGYTASSWTCSNGDNDGTISIALGDDITCSITNNDIAPTLTLIKQVTNNNGGAEAASAWTLTATGPTGFSGSGPSVSNGASFDAGTYNLSESGPSGYSASNWVCVGGNQTDGDSVVVELGDNVTCTITNDDQAATLIVRKVVINDNGGVLEADDFSFQVNSGGTQAFEADGQNNLTVNAGTYNITEPGVSGYVTTYDNCSNLNIPNGGSATCTITNNDIAPQLTVIKHVINDNGGNAVAGNFSMIVTGTNVSSTPFGGSESGTTVTLDAGSYSVGEIGLTGYSASFSTDCSGTIAIGGQKTCTITNNDIAPILHLKKIIDNRNGGTATVADFILTADGTGSNDISGTSQVNSDGTLLADTFVLSETANVSGYTAGTWNCVGGTQNGSSITLAINQEATCTITNDDIAPKLTLNKVVVNDNGGTAAESAWTLTATGPTTISGPGAAGSTDVVSNSSFKAGTYVLSESTGPAGYAASGWTCSNGDNDGTISVALGDDITCTITNNDIAPTLKLVKQVTNNNGGTAVAGNWNLTATGTNGFTDSGDSTTFHTVTAGVNYTLTESTVAGYAAGSWSCNGGIQNTNHITLGLDDDVTCTITNDDIQPKLTVTKVLANKGLVNTQISDFPLNVSQTSVTSGVQNGFDVGSYIVGEQNNTIYSYTSDITGDCDGDGNVSLEAGDIKSCIITNTLDTGTITVDKEIINNFDQDPGLFDLKIDGTTEASDQGDGGTTGAITVITGTHSVSEIAGTGTSLNDYSSEISCDDENDSNGSGTSLSNIQVNKGDEIICTITNTRKGDIIVVKYNDEDGDGELVGENPVLSGWTINLSGNTSQVTPDNGTVEFNNLVPGTYTLGENFQPGWEQTNISCPEYQTSNNDDGTIDVFVGAGQTVFCQILNHNLTPIFTISKENNTGGADKAPGDTVGYTITLNIDEEGGPATNVQVTDLLPEGFVYAAGSWEASSNNLGTLNVPEPTYASPGVWNLVDTTNGNTAYIFQPGDTIILTYSAKIDGSQATGIYPDSAWGQATPVGSSTVIFASAVNPGQLDSTFVGTQVSVVNPNQPGVSHNVTKTQEVLGASTFLPATGENTLWVIIATLFSITGFGMLIAGLRLRKKYVK